MNMTKIIERIYPVYLNKPAGEIKRFESIQVSTIVIQNLGDEG